MTTTQLEFSTLSPAAQEHEVESSGPMAEEFKEFLNCVVEMLVSVTYKDSAALEETERVEG